MLRQQIRIERCLRPMDAHLIIGVGVDLAVCIAIRPVAENVFATAIGRRRQHQQIVDRTKLTVCTRSVQTHPDSCQRRFVGILQTIRVLIQPDTVANLQRSWFTHNFQVTYPRAFEEIIAYNVSATSFGTGQAAQVIGPLRINGVVRVDRPHHHLTTPWQHSQSAILGVEMKRHESPPVKLAATHPHRIAPAQRTTARPLLDKCAVDVAQTDGVTASDKVRRHRVDLVGGALMAGAVDDLEHQRAVVVELDVCQDRLFVAHHIRSHILPGHKTRGSVEPVIRHIPPYRRGRVVRQRELCHRSSLPAACHNVVPIDRSREMVGILRDERVTDDTRVDKPLTHGDPPRTSFPTTTGRHRDSSLGKDIAGPDRIAATQRSLAFHPNGNQLLAIEVGQPQRLSFFIQVHIADPSFGNPFSYDQRIVVLGRTHCVAREAARPQIQPQRCQIHQRLDRIGVTRCHPIDAAEPQRPQLDRTFDQGRDQNLPLGPVHCHPPGRTDISPFGLSQIFACADSCRPVPPGDYAVLGGSVAACNQRIGSRSRSAIQDGHRNVRGCTSRGVQVGHAIVHCAGGPVLETDTGA